MEGAGENSFMFMNTLCFVFYWGGIGVSGRCRLPYFLVSFFALFNLFFFVVFFFIFFLAFFLSYLSFFALLRLADPKRLRLRCFIDIAKIVHVNIIRELLKTDEFKVRCR